MELSIRKALAHEYEVLSDIAIKSKAYWGYSDKFIQACQHELIVSEADLLNPLYTYWLAYDDNGIVAYTALKPINDDVIELDALFVSPNRLGRGIGKRLFQHILPLLCVSSYAYLEILSDPHAAGFYEKMGAKYIGDKASNYIKDRKLPIYRVKLRNIEVVI